MPLFETMKPLNRGTLRAPHKDRSHPDYKCSLMLGTGELRTRPKRDRVGELVVRARMADGTFQDVREWTSMDQAAEHKAARWGSRKERRAAREAARERAGRAILAHIGADGSGRERPKSEAPAPGLFLARQRFLQALG